MKSFLKTPLLFAAAGLLAASAAHAQVIPTYEWNAATDTGGDGIWENEQTVTAERDWAFNDSATPTASSVTSGFGQITHAYAFGASELDGATTSAFQNSDVDTADNIATFEFWVRPSDLTSKGVIWETGASSGAAVWYDEGTFNYDSNNSNTGNPASFTISDVSDFYQVVVQVNGSNGVNMWVNGIGEADPSATVVDIESNDIRAPFGGGNEAGLGNVGGNVGGYVPSDAQKVFEGEIALMRFYDSGLDGADVEDLYDAAVIPEPSTFALMAGALGLAVVMVRRRRS